VTAITDPLSFCEYPGPFRFGRQRLPLLSAEQETGMSLGTMAVGGLMVAAVLIVVAITLINKFAD